MATMYALPALTAWDGTTGSGSWSNTSGGASNGTFPSSTTDVIFDANSGSARTIFLNNAQCKSVNMAAANAMTFTNNGGSTDGTLNVIGGAGSAVDVSTALLMPTLAVGGVVSLKGGNCVFSTVTNSGTLTLTLAGDLNCSNGSILLNAVGGTFSAGVYNVTTTGFQGGASTTLNMGSGTWTCLGTWNPSGTTIVPQTSTLKMVNASAGQGLYPTAAGLYNLEIANSGAGYTFIQSSLTVNNLLTIRPNALLQIQQSTTLTVAGILADGNGGNLRIQSTSTVLANLAKSGGGTLTLTKVSFTYINGSPAGAVKAVNSTNAGGSTNITFLSGNSNNLSFI